MNSAPIPPRIFSRSNSVFSVLWITAFRMQYNHISEQKTHCFQGTKDAFWQERTINSSTLLKRPAAPHLSRCMGPMIYSKDAPFLLIREGTNVCTTMVMSYLLAITMVPTPKVLISFLFFIFHVAGGVGFIKAAALVVCSSISKEPLKGRTS